MKKVLIASCLAVGLAGCNATVYTPRPGIDVAVASPVYVAPVPRPYIAQRHYVAPYLYGYRRPAQHCYSTWDRTPYGMRERRICRAW